MDGEESTSNFSGHEHHLSQAEEPVLPDACFAGRQGRRELS